ncbi:MAG: DUF3298 domain-containing protein [Clostridia bacterium]|nr:DUF3298 domain-containing protein [Clostridia bacterium]
MHNSLKAALILIPCLLCSCGASTGLKTKTEAVSEETEAYSINCESLTVEGSSEGIALLNSLFSEELNEWTDNFTSRAAEITVPGSSSPCMQVRHIIKKNNSKIFSAVTEKYVYLNGLHGNTWVTAKNFDIEQDRILRLSDLFSDETYEHILTERITELIKNNPETYHDLWEEPIVDAAREDKFYLDEKNLVIFYEPYELSYYARGVVEFPIPTEKIRGYLKPEYLPQ